MKILLVCGSPRRGNSESIILYLEQLLKAKRMKTEILLLREKNINRCLGCVEYCNHKLKCRINDDMPSIMKKMEQANGFVFVTPNYFKMPPGLFKDFIDRCSVFYTAGKQDFFSKKRAVVICVGADETKHIDVCVINIADNFCKTLGINVVGKKSFRSHSELKGNYNDIFENKLNPKIEEDLNKLALKLIC